MTCGATAGPVVGHLQPLEPRASKPGEAHVSLKKANIYMRHMRMKSEDKLTAT